MSIKKGPTAFAQDRLLTEVELELMNIIWSLNQATIKEIVSHLPKERPFSLYHCGNRSKSARTERVS
jgi:hypothetical protein